VLTERKNGHFYITIARMLSICWTLKGQRRLGSGQPTGKRLFNFASFVAFERGPVEG
jgi:hypothetical protein